MAQKSAVDQEKKNAAKRKKPKFMITRVVRFSTSISETDARGNIADNRLSHAIDPDGLIGQRVFEAVRSKPPSGFPRRGFGAIPRRKQ